MRFSVRDGASAAFETYQEGALKVRLPKVYEGPPEAVLINTAGGLTGGDRADIKVNVETGAAAVITGQACEKIYKSAGGEAEISTSATVDEGASLEWLVQPTILFDRGRMRRTMAVDMTEGARFLGVEAVVFGRTAMTETVTRGFVADTWRVRRAGRLVYADTFRIDGDIKAVLTNPAALAGFQAMATMIYAAPDAQARRGELREITADLRSVAAVSAWNGLLVARFAAIDGYWLTQDLVAVLTRFRAKSLPRVWTM